MGDDQWILITDPLNDPLNIFNDGPFKSLGIVTLFWKCDKR